MSLRALSAPFAIAAALLANAAVAKTYDCKLGPPKALSQDGRKVALNEINFPQFKSEPWKVQVRLVKGRAGNPDTAVVTWPSNPIQIAGEFPILPIAKRTFAFVSVSEGPCMFTTMACLSTIQIADQGKGKANILISPTALWTDDTTNQSDPFVVVIEGTCSWKDPE